jgi:hypothetical protein
MTNHNTPQLSGMDSAKHCAAFPGLSALSATTVHVQGQFVFFSIAVFKFVGFQVFTAMTEELSAT